ncbi:MAG: FtsX-like permease family protein [Nitrososphaeria archaeon]
MIYRDYQPSQWQNTGVGPPSAYPSVEAYVDASQEYQSVLLKTAIERFRILKYNNLGGMALFMLTDCHPAVTWSIIDYYRIPKAAYYAVKNAYNPTHVLIDWKGEYEIRDKYRVFYASDSTAEFDLLVVNDLPHAFENAELRWRMVDLTEGNTLLQEVVPKMTIPDGEAQPVRMTNVTWDVPSFVDQDHSFVLETSLLASSGDLIDRNNVSFTVEASSQLVISAEGSDFVPNAEFAVIVDETHVYFAETNTSGLAKLTLPGGHRVVILGPVLKDTSQIYVPSIVDLGTVEPATTVPISLKLVPGAIVRVLGNIPPVEGDAPVKLSLNIIPRTPLWDPSWITAYGSLSPFRPYLLNMTGDMAIAPAGYPFEMRVMSDDVEIFEPLVIDDGGKPFDLSRNEQVTSRRLAKLIISRNEEVVQDALEEAVEGVNEAESLGLYVALELGRLQQVESSLEKASNALSREEVFEAANRLKEAYNLCQNIISELDRLQSESATSIPLLMLLLVLTSLSVAALSTEKKGEQLITASLLLSAILVLLYYTYPGFKYANVNDYVTAGYIVILVIVAVSLGSEFLGNVKSVGGVSLLPAIAASTSLAIRNLKRRKLRTVLILLSVTIMVVGFTWLTTVSTVISTREIKVTPLTPFKRTNFVIASKVNRPLNYDDITWISSQPETKALAIKAQSMPTSSPLGYVKTPSFGVYGIIGIAATDPNLETISNAVTPKNSLDKVLGLSKAVLVSGNLIEEAGVKIGDKVTVSGAKLEIAGFFDPDRIEAVRDIDDVAWLPDKMNLMGDLTPVRGDELIITNVYAAAELGSPLVRAYIQTLDSQSRDLARKLSLLSSYFTKSYPRADVSYLYLASSVVLEVKGSLMIIPVALVILNMAAIMMAGIYARRKEISILSMVGLNPSHVTYVFLCEALVIGLTGGGVGYLGGVIAFKVLGVLGVYVPTDVKATSLDMITVVGLTVITTVLSYLVPSLKASTLVTPSLRRRWKLEGTSTATGTWSTEIPAKIPSEKVASFVDHLCKRMREEGAGLEISVSNARWDKQVVKGSLAYRVFFKYSRGGGRPFTSDARMTLERSDGDYTVSLDCKTLSRYPRFADFYVHEVASYVRKLVLEWVSFGSRVMVPLGENMDQIIRLVKAYNPQLVSVVYRKATALKRPVRQIEESLRYQGLLVPAVKLSAIQGNEIRKLAEELTVLAREVDIICTDSDDGLLSIALAIAGMKEKKRLCYFADGRLVEEPPETFMQLMPAD